MKIKINDTFFIMARHLYTWDILKEKGFECNFFNWGCSNVFKEEDGELLLVLKYLGNRIVEEMVTGEKILIPYGATLEDCNEHIYSVEDNYDEHFKRAGGTIPEYVNQLENLNAMAERYPLVIDDEDYEVYDIGGLKYMTYGDLYEDFGELSDFDNIDFEKENQYIIADMIKKEYLKISPEKRKEIINRQKNMAIEQTEIFRNKINEVLNKCKVNDELLDMAYFENQLYDFKNNIKTNDVNKENLNKDRASYEFDYMSFLEKQNNKTKNLNKDRASYEFDYMSFLEKQNNKTK